MSRPSMKSIGEAKSSQVVIPNFLLSGLGSEFKAHFTDGALESVPANFESHLIDAMDQIVTGELKSSQLVALLKEIGLSHVHKQCNVCIANVLWLYGTQTDPVTEETRWHNIAGLVKEIVSAGLVDTTILKSSLEFNLLVAAGLMRDEATHQKRLIKINTGLVFKQQKYNLLREETEGYSKLSVMLCNDMPVHPQGMSASDISGLMRQFIANVFSVVGHFDLEPNRVLDLILDSFESKPTNLCFLPLIERFRRTSIVHILGFKFTMYHLPRVLKPVEATQTTAPGTAPGSGRAATTAAGDNLIRSAHEDIVGSDAPQSLYVLAAMLVMNNLVDIEDLLPYLRPSLQRLIAALQGLDADLAQQAASYGVVSLNSAKATSNNKATSGTLTNTAVAGTAKAIPLSVDCSTKAAAAPSNSRRPQPPSTPAPSSSGITKIPPPPQPLKASSISLRAAGSSASLSKSQSSTKLAPTEKTGETEGVELDVVDPSKFALFYDPANLPLPASTPTEAAAAEDSKTDSAPASANDVRQQDVTNGPAYAEGNELIGLICALLSVRGWAQARYLLNLLEMSGADPLLVMTYSADLRCSMAALANWQLDRVYSQHSTYGAGHGFAKPLSILPLTTKAKPAERPSQQTAPPLTVAQKFSSATVFVGQAPETAQPQLGRIETLDEFPHEAGLLLSYLGYHVREFPGLFSRLGRLCKASIQAGTPVVNETAGDMVMSEASNEPAISLLCNVLLPALSAYQENNPFLAGQVWDAIRALSFAQRFAIYDRWYGGGLGKEGTGCKHPEVVLAETVALHGARAELKRLAKENTKQVGRKLARFTMACPLVVFNHVLSQVEVFDNLIPYMVDTLKFSTELARDVMAYSLVSQLKKGSNGDAKLKKGDTHFSQWFSALTKFIATFYCRYPTTELKGLLNYLLQRLSIGDSLDLLVLRELLGIMGGSETLVEVSPAQLEGLSGGRALRAEVMGLAAGVVGSKGMISASACKKATAILRDELIGSQTAIPLLLMIAQVRSRLLHDPDTTQLKLISHLYDTAQDVLMQFTEFLIAGAKSIESIATLMPDLSVLLGEVGLAVPVAFQLVRPLLRGALQFGLDPSSAPAHLQRWHPFGEHMSELVSSLIQPSVMWAHLSPRLYIIFWSLGLYDIKVPVSRYESEIKRLKDRYTELDSRKSGTAASMGITPAELNKQNRARDLEMKQLLQKVADLTDDMVKQKSHVDQMREIIRSEQASYFRNGGLKSAEDSAPLLKPEDAVSASVTQHLLYPRLLMSPIDAVYCTQFCFLLHEMETPLFSTTHFVDRVISTVSPLIFCTTEAEAAFIGYALVDLLQTINRWHDDEAAFKIEAAEKLGCSFAAAEGATEEGQCAITVSAPASAAGGDEGAEAKQEMEVETATESSGLSHSKFKTLCKDWHTKLFSVIRASFKVKDREYIYIRSGLILLAKVSEHFPSRAKEGDQLVTVVQQLQAQETQRGDLQIMAKSLLTILKKRANSWLNDSPQRRLAAIKAQAKAAALAKAKSEKAAAVAAAPKEAQPEQPPARGRGATGNNNSAGPMRDDLSRRDCPGGGAFRHNDSRQDLGGRDRPMMSRDQFPRDREFPNRDSRDMRDRPPFPSARDHMGMSSSSGNLRDAQADSHSGGNRMRENSRDRDPRGNFPAPPLAVQASGLKRKNGGDEKADSNSSGNNALPPNKAVRRAATSNPKVDDGTKSFAPLQSNGPERHDKPHTAVSQTKASEGPRSRSQEKDKLKEAAQQDPASSKRSTVAKEQSKEESSRDRDSAKTPSGDAKDSKHNKQQADSGTAAPSNKRSREAAGLSADAAPDSSSASRRSSQERDDASSKRHSGTQLGSGPSKTEELLAMKSAAKQSGGGGSGSYTRHGDASASLLSLNNKTDAAQNSGSSPRGNNYPVGVQSSKATAIAGNREHPGPRLNHSNAPHAAQTRNAKGSDRFEDRGAPLHDRHQHHNHHHQAQQQQGGPLPSGPSPQMTGGKFVNKRYQPPLQNGPPPSQQLQHQPYPNRQQQQAPLTNSYPARGQQQRDGGPYDNNYGNKCYGDYPSHQQQGGGGRGAGPRRQDNNRDNNRR